MHSCRYPSFEVGILLDQLSAAVSIAMVTRCCVIETLLYAMQDGNEWPESKRFTWMIESAWNTHLAQEGR